MELNEVRVHDCITVIKTYKDRTKHFYDGNLNGVVVGKSDDNIILMDASGEEVEVRFPDYDLSFSELSEVVFKRDIQREVKRRRDTLKSAEDSLAETLAWYQTFTEEISFLGKLLRFASVLRK